MTRRRFVFCTYGFCHLTCVKIITKLLFSKQYNTFTMNSAPSDFYLCTLLIICLFLMIFITDKNDNTRTDP
jgi:hypothetical protein